MVMETPQIAVPDDMIGKPIGHHIVRRKLGEGGIGSVYVAEHPSIGKRVALKVLHAEFSSQAEIVVDRAPQGARPPTTGDTSSHR